jgi:hypothetical protein
LRATALCKDNRERQELGVSRAARKGQTITYRGPYLLLLGRQRRVTALSRLMVVARGDVLRR